MGYYVDLSNISLDEFKKKLKSTNLLPSQQILKENMDERFDTLRAQGIENMYELQKTLKTKDKVNKFAEITLLPTDFLIILRREVNSYHPQARKIRDFPCLKEETIKELEKLGIKTTVQLYDRVVTKDVRNKLKEELNITENEILLLTKLTDVSRIRYVNQTFANLLMNSDYDTAEKINKADYEELYENLIKLNRGKKYFRGNIGLIDMKFFVEDTANVSFDIEY